MKPRREDTRPLLSPAPSGRRRSGDSGTPYPPLSPQGRARPAQVVAPKPHASALGGDAEPQPLPLLPACPSVSISSLICLTSEKTTFKVNKINQNDADFSH